MHVSCNFASTAPPSVIKPLPVLFCSGDSESCFLSAIMEVLVSIFKLSRSILYCCNWSEKLWFLCLACALSIKFVTVFALFPADMSQERKIKAQHAPVFAWALHGRVSAQALLCLPGCCPDSLPPLWCNFFGTQRNPA